MIMIYIDRSRYHPSDWGEGSMQMAENILVREYQLTRPDWIAEDFYKTTLFTDVPTKVYSPPAPAARCYQTVLNASAVCLHTADIRTPITCALSCPTAGEHFVSVDFADIGTPKGSCGSYAIDTACTGNPGEAVSVVSKLCLGKAKCSVGANTATLSPSAPNICDGVIKSTSIQLSCGK
jgi:hypothetical protein